MDPEAGAGAREDVDMTNPPLAKSIEHDSDAENGQGMEVSEGKSSSMNSSNSGPTIEGTGPIVDGTGEDGPVKADVPPLCEQIQTIETLLKAFNDRLPQEGETIYLVSTKWLAKAQALGGAAKQPIKEAPDGPLGPVDNSEVVQEVVKDIQGNNFVKLKPGTTLGEDVEAFPADAWDLVLVWHGLAAGQLPITRTARNTSPDAVSEPNIQYEMFPPVFTVHRLWSAHSPIPIDQQLKATDPPAVEVATSSSMVFQDFLKQIKGRAGIDLQTKVRVWRLPQRLPASSSQAPQPAALSTPPDSPDRTPNEDGVESSETAIPRLLLDVERFTKLERGVEREVVEGAKDQTMNANYNGRSMTLQILGLTVDETLVLDEATDLKNFVSTYNPKTASAKDLVSRGSSTSLTAQNRTNTSGRSSPAPQGPLTRGRASHKSGRTIGCIGLSNLGNTCYMNSALQCVRSVEELTKYFLTKEAYEEINKDNPLAHNGDVAVAYGHLLEDIYRDPPPTSVVPRHFKNVIGRYAPAFSGYGQQDSQEFLGFLLDGLQEDLSRVKKKPYIEKPDSTDDMISNPDAIRKMADQVWDITKRRDDSVIADLFTGMYKSTLVCPVCQKISITFDPFNNLTLPLPVQNSWSRPVRFYPLNDAPVEFNVDMDRNSSIKALREYVSSRVGVPAERLIGAEEFKGKFFKAYDDFSSVAEEIQTNDLAAFHELEAVPTNLARQKPKKQKFRSMLSMGDDDDDEEKPEWDDPAAERMVVPVLHRFAPDSRSNRNRFGKKSAVQTPPHFIVVSRDEAYSEDAIRRKVLEKLASLSTWPEFAAADEDDSETGENTDSDIVATTTSDGDSSGGSKVVARSVEGEDDLVDVTMKDAVDGPKSTADPSASSPEYPQQLKKFNKRRPKWVNPNQYLNAQFQNLFELGYFSEPGRSVPTGWSGFTEDRSYPTLSSRAPEPAASPDQDMQSPSNCSNEGDSENESSSNGDAGSQTTEAVTRMADESSEEDEASIPAIKDLNVRPDGPRGAHRGGPGGRKKFKPHKTYGKRGNKRRDKQMRAAREPQGTFEMPDVRMSTPDNGPLIRLGEVIVVDWSETAFDSVFGKDSHDDHMRGEPTFANVEVLVDEATESKKKARAARKRNGISLDDCLDEFEKEEILSEQDTWYCPRCKEHRRASKKFDLWKTPDILVVHLKRFSSSGWRRDKLDIKVDFPVEGLDLTRRVINKETGKEEIYDLIAVDDHWGGLGGGHYTAFAKSFVDGDWYEYNDSSVSKTKNLQSMVTSAAYLLFYRRRSDVPLGGPRFQEIFDKFGAQTPDDGLSESGEGQYLGQGSSLRGSSSALTGAGAAHRGGDRGLASGASSQTSGGGASTELPPAYHDGDNDNGGPSWSFADNSDTIHPTIEDEGVGMADNWNATTWNFDSIGAAAKAGSDAGSDDAQANSSSDTDVSLGGVVGDHDPDEAMLLADDDEEDGPGGGSEPVAFGDYQEPPPPAYHIQAGLDDLRQHVWDSKTYEIPPEGDDDAASGKVVEIRIDDDETK